MTAWETVGTEAVIERDYWGRPYIYPPRGGKKTAYTRCTTFVDCIEDKFGLQQWLQRMTAIGLADRPDLVLSVSTNRDDPKKLNRICEDAVEHAGGTAAATTGTALHSLTEALDRGEKLPPLKDETAADVEAYRVATADLRPVHIEEFTVQDQLHVGGTPDRIVEFPYGSGDLYIADLKTGSIKYGALKIAMQLAMYAHSNLYNPSTYARTHHHASANRGIVIHLPAGTGTCELHWIDLEAGWEAVQIAARVRNRRKLKFAQLVRPFDSAEKPARPSMRKEKADALAAQIAAALTPEAVRNLYRDHRDDWTTNLTALARSRVEELESSAA